MAISDRLNKLTTDITNAYTSIENKGGTIPANKNTNNLSTAIDSIEVIEQATAERESLSLTNTKAMPYSDYVVEGKSDQETGKSKNLFDYKQIISSASMSIENGGFIINNTDFQNGYLIGILKNLCPELKVGDKFKFTWDSNATRNNSDVNYIYLNLYANAIKKDITYTCTQEMLDSEAFFYGQQGQYYKNIIFYLDGQTSDYEPYGEKPSPSIPSEIHSVADDVNLFDIGVKSDYRGYNDQNVTTQGNYSWFTIENNKLKYLVQDYGTTLIYNKNQYKGNQSYNLQYVASSIYSRMLIKLRNGSDNGWLTDSDVTISGWTYIGSYNGWFIEFSEATNIEKIVNIPNCLYCVFGFGYGSRSGTTGTNQTISFIKIAKGTTSTPYSPYNQGTVTIKQRGKNLAYTGWAENFVNAVNNSNQTKIETYQNKNCLYFTPIAGSGSYPTKNLTLGISFKENTQYTISCDILKLNKPHNTLAIQYTDGTSTPFTTVSATNTWEHKTITSTLNKTIAFIRPNYTDGNTYINIDTWQIEERNNSNYLRTISS